MYPVSEINLTSEQEKFSVWIFSACSPEPELSMNENGAGVLRIGKRICQIQCIGPDMKILRSWRWTPDFPDLYVFEVNQGTAGTYAMTESHSLVIVNTGGPELKVLFDEPISEVTTQADTSGAENFTSEIVTPYRLEKGKSGKPIVIFGKEAKPISLDYSGAK